jgi:hypothetical protein
MNGHPSAWTATQHQISVFTAIGANIKDANWAFGDF